MKRIAMMMQAFTGHGAHRAADRIPALEAEAARWQAVAFEAQAKLDHADALMARVCAEKSAVLVENARLVAELDIVTEAHRLLEKENDELAARLIEARADRANALTVSSPAPADHGPAIRLHDPDSTTEINVTTLWNGLGLRLNKQHAA